MIKKLEIIAIFFAALLLNSCNNQNNQRDINTILLCALDELMKHNEFQSFLIDGDNYLAWVPDGYIEKDNVNTGEGVVAWNSLEYKKVDTSYIAVLNTRFPEGHKLKLVSQQENEAILRYKKDGQFCSWFVGGMKQYKDRYYFTLGFAISPKAGIGAYFEIELVDGKCNIINYEPAIL